MRDGWRTFWVLAMGAYALSAPAETLLNDGGTHVVSDNTYATDPLRLEDSPAGLTTTLTIRDPAIVAGDPFAAVGTIAVSAEATHGGHAVLQMQGGTVVGLDARGGSLLDITGGRLQAPMYGIPVLRAGDTAGPVIVGIAGGQFDGGIDLGDNVTLTMSGGTIGQLPAWQSIRAASSVGATSLTVSGGSSPDGWNWAPTPTPS